jgi:hypothetical protein
LVATPDLEAPATVTDLDVRDTPATVTDLADRRAERARLELEPKGA